MANEIITKKLKNNLIFSFSYIILEQKGDKNELYLL